MGSARSAGEQVFGLIQRFAPGFRDQVLEHQVLGPPDIEERIGLTAGRIFQGQGFPDQLWDRRLSLPARRSKAFISPAPPPIRPAASSA